MTAQPQQYCLKWKYHNSNIQSTFSLLREKAHYTDVTLWCGGTVMRAHRAVLAACSTLFGELLSNHDYSHGEPAIILTDSIHAYHLKHLLAFMYSGEVSVHHSELTSLLKTADDLQIKGLADISWKDPHTSDSSSGTATEISSTPPSPSDGHVSNSKSDEEPVKNNKKNSENMSVFNCMNGSLLLPNGDPFKRKRGRPPLEPKCVPQSEILLDVPKKHKMTATPNILRKSKAFSESKNDMIVDMHPGWLIGNGKNDEIEENLSEYSEASLDGKDISHFLDTTMEEEPPEHSIKSEKSKANASNENGFSLDTDDIIKKNHEKSLYGDVIQLSEYLLSGRRTQFWGEDYVKRVMEAVFCKELEMKHAAEILGVSYGTLYGRYRDTFGCINRPYRSRDFWSENSDILTKLQRKEISFLKAAELLNITPPMLFTHINSALESTSNKDLLNIFKENSLSNDENATDINSENDNDNLPEEKKESSYNFLTDILRKKNHDKDESVKEIEISESKSNKLIDDTSKAESSSRDKSNSDVNKSKTPMIETKSSTTVPTTTKKLPVIRVADLKFLKGESPGPVNLTELGDKSSPIILKTSQIIRPDIQMITSKRKVTFEEIELVLKQSKKLSPSAIKPSTSIT